MTKLNGFSYPQSRTGASSLLPAPPWHFVGDFITVRYRTDPAGVASFLPDGVELADPSGVVNLVIADWQSCSEDRTELLDPVRAQYKECYIDVDVIHQGERFARVIHIWVDKDFALVRGLYQGYPKKLGSIWMTRAYPFGKAAPRLEAGAQFGASVTASDRRLVDVTLVLTEEQTDGFAPPPVRLHTRRVASIEPGAPDALDELVVFRRDDAERGPTWRGTATVSLYGSPLEELELLTPHEILGATYTTMASSWNGGEVRARTPAAGS